MSPLLRRLLEKPLGLRSTAVAGLIGLAVFCLANLGLADLSAGSPKPPKVTERFEKAIDKAAIYFSLPDAVADQMLSQIGFDHPGIPDADWRQFSAYHRLETAYWCAEAADPQRGGERMLALLSRALAMEYDSFRNDPELRDLIAQGTQLARDNTRVRFNALDPDAKRPELPAKFRRPLEILTMFCDGGALGVHHTLTHHFGLTADEAVGIIRTSRTTGDALGRGIMAVAEGRRDQAMQSLVRDYDNEFESFRAERVFDTWRPKPGDRIIVRELPSPPPTRTINPWDRGDGPSTLPPAWKPDPKTPPAGRTDEVRRAWNDYNSRKFNDFIKREYRPPAGGAGVKVPSFKGIMKSIRGFGGVFLGNEVIDSGLPEVRSIKWKADPKQADVGALIFLIGKQEVTLSPVRQEDAFAARKLLFGGDGVAAVDDEAGIGLFGLMTSIPHLECGPNKINDAGRRWRFVVHPAIGDLNLGWATLLCDVSVLEEQRQQLLSRFANANDARDFGAIFRNNKWVTYKFHDVPMLITIKNDQLSLERHPTNGITDTPKLRNEALRRTAFLSLKFYSYKTDKGKIVLDKNKDPVTEIGDVDDEFYPLVPALLKASPAYDRLNEFAKVLAACRWAKSKGAKWENPVGKVAGTTPFGSVIVTRKSIVPAAEFDPIEGLIELHEKVRWRLSTLRLAQRGNAKVKVPQKYLEDLEDSLNNLGNDLEDRLIQSKTPEKELINAEKKINANDQLDAVRKASRCHQYEIEMSPGHVYLIDADSDDFDPCIRLELKDRVLASDGDAGGVGSVRIVFTVAEKGKYRVVLTTHADGKTGEYGLSVRQFERPSMNAIKARNDR